MRQAPLSRAGSLPQGYELYSKCMANRIHCGSEPAREEARTGNSNPTELTQQIRIQMLLHQIRQPLDIALAQAVVIHLLHIA